MEWIFLTASFWVIAIPWMLFGIAAGIAASNKGRSGCGWYIIGCLLGPFGLLFILLAKRLPTDDERKCPFCAETIQRDAKLCRFCRNEVPPVRAPVSNLTFDEWIAAQGLDFDKMSASDQKMYKYAWKLEQMH